MTDKIPFDKLNDGDFLVKGNWLFIFDHFEPGRLIRGGNIFFYKALVSLNDTYIHIPQFPTRGIGYYEDQYAELRYATNYERKMFMDKLKMKRYSYNEETKRIEII